MTAPAAEQQTAKPNRMDRRRLETRGKLLAATLKLVIKKGIDKTTLDDITEAADLGRRTFYYHFSGKDECIQAAAASVYQYHAERIDLAEQAEDPALIVAISVQVMLAALLDEPVTRSLMDRPRLLGQAIVRALGEFIRRDITLGIEAGRFEPPVAPEKLDSMMMWTIVGVVIESADITDDRAAVLRDYAQAFLMILGVSAAEAKANADMAMTALAR
jgi:AcrR family transcriptional regulator